MLLAREFVAYLSRQLVAKLIPGVIETPSPDLVAGKVAELTLGRAHITCNKNGVPFDPAKPTITSGIRLGTPACTTRGFGIAEFRQVGEMVVEVIDVLSQKHTEEDSLVEAAVRDKVKSLLARFPIYQD